MCNMDASMTTAIDALIAIAMWARVWLNHT